MIASSGFVSSILIGYLQKAKNRITLHKYDQLFDNGIYFYGVWPLQPELSIQIKCKESKKGIDMYNAYIEKIYEKGVISKGTFKKADG